jgi:hypothetical protein
MTLSFFPSPVDPVYAWIDFLITPPDLLFFDDEISLAHSVWNKLGYRSQYDQDIFSLRFDLLMTSCHLTWLGAMSNQYHKQFPQCLLVSVMHIFMLLFHNPIWLFLHLKQAPNLHCKMSPIVCSPHSPSLINSGQPLRQLTSCICIALPYLYPAKDNNRLWWYTFRQITGYGEYPYLSPYLAQTISTLACKTEKSWENHTPRHFPNTHHCGDTRAIPPLWLLDQFNQSKH